MSQHSLLRTNSCNLIVITFLIILAGCSSQNHPSSNTGLTPQSSTNSGLSISANGPALNPQGIDFSTQELHIHSDNGLQCPASFSEPGNLIIASDNLNQVYDSDQIQQMITYLHKLGPNSFLKSIPSTFRWVSGGPLENNPIRLDEGGIKLNGCGFFLQITNNSQIPVQISRVGVKLTEATQHNDFQYHLVDLCSLEGSDYCHQYGGGPGPCDIYIATIHLKESAAGTIFDAIPSGGDPTCNELTIQPQSAIDLVINLYSSKNLIYSVMPEITVDTGNSPNPPIELSNSPDILTFAYNNQFTCYGFQTDRFVLENPVPKNSICI